MDRALSRFGKSSPCDLIDGTMSTDGALLLYNPRQILKTYRDKPRALTRCYLHMVPHCVFSHNLMNTLVNRELWDLSCDIAMEMPSSRYSFPAQAAPVPPSKAM